MVFANRLSTLNIVNAAFWALALAVVLLPVGLGGNRPLPLGLAQAALALSATGLLLNQEYWQGLKWPPRVLWALGLFAGVFAWAWLQTQPFLPAAWSHPLWMEAGVSLKKDLHGAVALAPEDALYGLSRLITYVVAGFLAYAFGQDAKKAKRLLEIIWISGVAICLYGLAMHALGVQKILWIDKWAYQTDLTATFVSRNHFAVYAGVIFVTGLALMMQSWREAMRDQKPTMRASIAQNWIQKEGLPRGFLLLLVFLCVILSHSRAGFLITVAGVCGYVFFFQIYTKNYRRALLVGLLAVVIAVAIIAVATQYSDRFAKFLNDYSSFDRIKVYKIILNAVKDNPLLGYGLNGFQAVFRMYQYNMVMEFNRAHSDVLAALLDLGVPMGLALWAAVGLLISGLWHGIRTRRRHGIFPTLGFTVSLMVLSHASIDFSLQIPGVAVLWAALVGTGLAQSWSSSEKRPLT
ncbi:MAG: O-antigen ligase family protein [Proteobacteria bacterium]|nr:O-antigen ligase family protein [Pseudomonadota bacterium]